jgi:uncharacterized protein
MKHRFLGSVFSLGMIFCAAGLLSAQTIQVDQKNRTIAVTATDRAQAESDIAVVTIGFKIYAPESDAAYWQGSKLSNGIIDVLKKAGIPDKAIESQNQSLSHTEFDESNKDTPEIRSQKQFTFVQSWTVKTPVKDASAVLHTAIEAGANESGNVSWELSDHNALQAQAAAKALIRAREIASQMASGLQTHLGMLIYASNQTPIQRFVLNNSISMASLSTTRSEPVPLPLVLKPQQVEESATVYAVFAIE